MQITYQEYLDKVHGGWIGKCLGGAAGAPVEGIKKVIPYEHYREVIRPDLPNDDLDLQLLWLEVLQKKGPAITSRDLADAWNEQCWYPFSEYGIFLKNYERGIMPPYSGSFNNPVFKEGEGCPIRSEIWGMIFPGNPKKAAEYARMDACLDHAEASVWIEEYYAAMEAAAFEETDISRLITGSLCYLPEDSRPRNCVQDVCKDYESGCRDWETARTRMMRKYAHFDFTNAVTNLGIVIIALLYGEGDMDRTVNIAFRCGYDTDCTCATAAALLGITIGASGIDPSLKALVDDSFVIGIDVERQNNSIAELSKETCAIGILAGAAAITDIPSGIDIPNPAPRKADIEFDIKYKAFPAIGRMDQCPCEIIIHNRTESKTEDLVTISGLPEGWDVFGSGQLVTLNPGESKSMPIVITTTEQVQNLNNKNLLHVNYAHAGADFGIAGAFVWQAAGPYFEALEKQDRPGLPSPHGEGCNLPTLECMVNNAAYLDKAYLDEQNFREAFTQEDTIWINAYEDLLPLDEVFTFRGQGAIYLKQTLISPEDRDIWVVIGNNDGYRLWINGEIVMERDEIRLWTPYNNYEIIHLNKGANEIVLKLLRRTESLKFSFGLRRYEGEHFHRKRWYVDFASEI